MNKIEAIAPGWIDMASHRDGITLIHVTSVFVALIQSDEYKNATEQQRHLMQWAVLFHDITKVPVQNGHDYVHGFKSAAVAGKALTKLDFLTNATDEEIDAWYDVTYTATLYSPEHDETVQDIAKLRPIVDGLRHIHGEDAYSIVLAILLHIAIVTDPEYPILAPMSELDMKYCITETAFPIIKAMLLADGSGWQLFAEDKSVEIKRRAHVTRVLDEFVTLLDFPRNN